MTSVGVAALGERDLDHVEVARHDRVREKLARLAQHLRAEVARGEVRQREHAHARGRGDLRSLARGRVRRLLRALALLLAEGRLVDEQLGALREVDVRERRRGVAGDEHLPPGARRPEHLLRRHDAAVGERDRLAGLEPAALGARRDAERVGGRDVEAAGRGSSTSA